MISPSRLLGVVLLACSGLPALLSAGNMEQPARRLLGSESLEESTLAEAKRALAFLPAVSKSGQAGDFGMAPAARSFALPRHRACKCAAVRLSLGRGACCAESMLSMPEGVL